MLDASEVFRLRTRRRARRQSRPLRRLHRRSTAVRVLGSESRRGLRTILLYVRFPHHLSDRVPC